MNKNKCNNQSNQKQIDSVDVQYKPNGSSIITPIYKRWWFWVILAVIAVVSFILGRADAKSDIQLVMI